MENGRTQHLKEDVMKATDSSWMRLIYNGKAE